MLKIFRKKIVSKIILWGLLILILPAFVMWGSASVSRSKDKGPKYVGTIDNKKISFEDFYWALSGVRSQVILNYFNQPKVLDAILGNKSLTAKLAWDRLLLLKEAKKLRIKVSNKDVIDFLEKHPLFSRNGKFDDRFYAYVLRNNIGLEPRAFEETARESLAIVKLTDAITKDVKVSDEETTAEYGKEFGKLRISYIVIDPNNFADKVEVASFDDKAMKDFYDKNKGGLVFHPKEGVKGPDRAATFDEAKDTIRKFLKEAEAKKLASKYADDIYNKLSEGMQKDGATFEKAAGKLGSKPLSTNLFSKGDSLEGVGDAAVISNAAYSLKAGEASKPVETNKGFIIFSVLERQNANKEKFEKEKAEYSKKVFEIKKAQSLEEWLRKLEDKAALNIKFEEIEQYYK